MSKAREIWKPLTSAGGKASKKYLISNYGKLGIRKADGSIEVRALKPTSGIYRYNYRQDGLNKTIFISREVAEAFVKKPSAKHVKVIHKDHDYLNNHYSNLVWATAEEHRRHTSGSPRARLARQNRAIVKSVHAHILTEKEVIALKKMIWDPARKLSFSKIAERFGVSEMQIYRIKRGVYWYHVRVPHEPVHPLYKQNLRNLSLIEKVIAESRSRKSRGRSSTPQAASDEQKKELLRLRDKKKKSKITVTIAVKKVVRSSANPARLPLARKQKSKSRKRGRNSAFPIRKAVR